MGENKFHHDRLRINGAYSVSLFGSSHLVWPREGPRVQGFVLSSNFPGGTSVSFARPIHVVVQNKLQDSSLGLLREPEPFRRLNKNGRIDHSGRGEQSVSARLSMNFLAAILLVSAA